jgi:hypothetical protein
MMVSCIITSKRPGNTPELTSRSKVGVSPFLPISGDRKVLPMQSVGNLWILYVFYPHEIHGTELNGEGKAEYMRIEAKTLSFHIEGCSFLNWTGTDQKRSFTVAETAARRIASSARGGT